MESVANDEIVYRLVKKGYVELENGQWRPTHDAFLGGKQRRVSVDRARKCGNDPTHTQEEKKDYICSLLVETVRGIDVGAKIEKGQEVLTYETRVDATPRCDNDAHADIYAYPERAGKRNFRLLREGLAAFAVWEAGFQPTKSNPPY